ELFAQLIILFLITQAIGLWTANTLIRENVHAEIIPGKGPEDVESSVGLFGYIIGFTIILLIAIKFLTGRLLYWLMKVLESAAILGTSFLVFASFVDHVFVGLVSIALVALRNIYSKNLWLRNVTSVLSAAGAGALIGVSLGVFPVLVFISMLAIYDLVAVFKTKHMVTIAKAVTKKNLSFTFAMPTKEHTFELGTGDMVIPLTFAVSVMAAGKQALVFPLFLVAPMLILAASLAGLLWTIDYCAKKPGRALPALPPQTVLMILAWLLAGALGF
ncbi:MAG: presenilin family intramembrane aspartyl protease, partial [Candidatus Diapherotrites archaeon]